MKKKLKILLAQLNPIGGDVKGNFKKLEDAWKRACEFKIDIILIINIAIKNKKVFWTFNSKIFFFLK